MTRKLITIMTAAALSIGGLIYLQAKEPGEHGPKHENHGPGPHHMMGNPLEHLSKDLELTDDQKAKVQPIIDQTKPQLTGHPQGGHGKDARATGKREHPDPAIAHAAATAKIRCDEKGARRHAQGDGGDARRQETVTAVTEGETDGGDRKVAADFLGRASYGADERSAL